MDTDDAQSDGLRPQFGRQYLPLGVEPKQKCITTISRVNNITLEWTIALGWKRQDQAVHHPIITRPWLGSETRQFPTILSSPDPG